MTSTNDRLVLVAWTGFLLGALIVLHRLATTFPSPPTTGVAVRSWLASTPPLLAAASLARLLALAAAWYLSVVTLLGVASRVLRLRRTTRLLDLVSPRSLRRVLAGAAGAGLAAQLVVLGASPATAGTQAVMHALPDAPPEPTSTTTMRALPDAPPEPTSTTTMRALPDAPAEPTSTTTMHALPDAPAEPTSTTTMHALPDTPPEPTSTTAMHALPDTPADAATASLRRLPDRTAPAATPSTGTTWTVEPGDHLWRIARVVLVLEHGDDVDDLVVEDYVERLVATNQDVLVQPDDPDLVLPGQQLRLPSP